MPTNLPLCPIGTNDIGLEGSNSLLGERASNSSPRLSIILQVDPVQNLGIGAFRRYAIPVKPSHALLVPLAMLPLTGCAATAARPVSPITQVRFQDLNALPAAPADRYYLLVFGAQTTPKLPRFTHCWATAVKVSECGPGKRSVVAPDTISWLPATCKVRPWRFQVESGKNLDLYTSLAVTLENCERVSVWGPYEISAGAYRKFLMQKTFLESGQIGYQCIDVVGEAARCRNGCNCIHALTDMDLLFDRRAYPIFRFGDVASELAVRHLVERGAIINPCQTHDWLLPALGLDRYPLVRRPYSPESQSPT